MKRSWWSPRRLGMALVLALSLALVSQSRVSHAWEFGEGDPDPGQSANQTWYVIAPLNLYERPDPSSKVLGVVPPGFNIITSERAGNYGIFLAKASTPDGKLLGWVRIDELVYKATFAY